jgi:hypothetical protein
MYRREHGRAFLRIGRASAGEETPPSRCGEDR